MDKKVAIEELKRCSGTQLDREVVEAFIQAYQNGEI
jgi:HD-GYP domain-containing protein (c-di-GMP phosphodiesterase class II)